MHALVGAVSKVILHVSTTAANVHDSRALAWMLNEEEDVGRTLFADSAYSGKNLEELTRSFNVNPCFCEKGYANTPLTKLQQKLNHLKSKIRCRIEHVFGYIETVFKGSFVRSIGLRRATFHSWQTALATTFFADKCSAAILVSDGTARTPEIVLQNFPNNRHNPRLPSSAAWRPLALVQQSSLLIRILIYGGLVPDI